ncbi:MAG: TolB family protein [Prolixibacteraceae bacterium]
MKKLFAFFIFLGWIGGAEAQYFQTGEDPASIKWRQLNSKNFQLIYPDYYEQQAQNLANVLEKIYQVGGYSLDHKPKKISVILHTQTVVSNGLVGWAPKRAEFYTTPPQSIYPQDWLEQLALHEFRHVVQIDKINEHLPGIIKGILGQQGTALVFGLHLPWWFIEGDAIVAETALSRYGRGRLPSFLMEHRAQVVQKGVFSYDKAYFRSYRDFVPNHYKLGYYLIGGSRIQYGTEIWADVLRQIGQQPVTFVPVTRVLKKEAGISKVGLYYSVFDSLQKVWLQEDKNFTPAKYEVISPASQTFTSYRYNHFLNDSTIVSHKTSFNTIPAFVKINKAGKEEKIFRPGHIFRESVDYRDNLIVWSEQIPDPRWTHSGKSLIRILDTDTKEVVEVDTEFKGFSPSVSPDKKKVVVVETDFSNNYYLSVYRIRDGDLLERFQTENNNYFFSPKWIDNTELAAIILNNEGKRIVRVNPGTGELKVILNNEMGEINSLRVAGNYLYFISSYSGKNSLYRFDFSNQSVVRIYEPRFGVETPGISDTQKIVLSDYTADGFRLIEVQALASHQVPLDDVEEASYRMADLLAKQEIGVPDFSEVDTVKYSSKKYSKVANLLNFHSWAPLFIDADEYEFTPGASLMSQNKLGTAQTILGYKYYTAEKTGQFYAGYKYRGWYPVFNFELTSGNRASEYMSINQVKNRTGEIVLQDTTLQRFTWGETNANVNVHLPLNFSKGAFNRRLQPEIGYNFVFHKRHESSPHRFFEGNFQSLNYRLYYHQLLKKSYRDVYPDVGIVLDLGFIHSPIGATDLGNRTTLQSILYLPGAMNNHGIKLYGGFQNKQPGNNRNFSDALRYPRGWGKINTHQMYTATADYKLPLIYPDWNIEGILYMRRANLTLFADYAWLKGNIYEEGKRTGIFTKNINAYGGELTFDVNALRFYAPTTVGVRASYIPELKDVYFNFLFSLNFTSF